MEDFSSIIFFNFLLSSILGTFIKDVVQKCIEFNAEGQNKNMYNNPKRPYSNYVPGLEVRS